MRAGAFAFGVVVVLVIGVAIGSLATAGPEQRRIEGQLADLRREHAALKAWIAQELRPWAADVVKVVDNGPSEAPGEAPGESPAPSASPLAPLAPLPSPSPSEAPTPSPTPLGESPSPSLCLPIICEVSPSIEGGASE